MLSEVPDGWVIGKLGDFLSKTYGGGTPSKTNSDYWNGSILWASVKDMTDFHPKTTKDTITQLGLENSSSKLVPAGEVILCTRMAVGVARVFSKKVAINQDLTALIPSGELLRSFLYYWLAYKKTEFEDESTGTTVKGLRKERLLSKQLNLPPLTEQKRIAEVLSSVDESIQATQRLIEQAERVKEVFASSVVSGDNPNFRSVKFGPITELCDINPRQKMVKGETYAFVDMASLPIKNSLEIKYARKELGSGGAKFQNGDTLFARITPCTENGKLGYVSELKQNELAFGSTEFTVLRPRFSASKLVYIYCYAGALREHLITRMVGSTGRQRVPNEAFSELDIAFYDEKSQQAIIAVFDELERTQYENKELLSALEKTKKGLMDDLLTGQVRTV